MKALLTPSIVASSDFGSQGAVRMDGGLLRGGSRVGVGKLSPENSSIKYLGVEFLGYDEVIILVSYFFLPPLLTYLPQPRGVSGYLRVEGGAENVRLLLYGNTDAVHPGERRDPRAALLDSGGADEVGFIAELAGVHSISHDFHLAKPEIGGEKR